ncbi:beta-1,3-glucan-binding protein-like [Anthonomus grandis grandis]|uniref:beta-1,3-glucan-binding protein-like n=1 Tax=Anthonomus grandis grandis TaxID=2921223 RepID=UPI0021658EDB|nr:beta-1,3-glucan-binding protein-like [Anthonomus grandis grandis]
MVNRVTCLLVILVNFGSYNAYEIPKVTFEAFYPKGLRVSIPAEKGVNIFAVHGNINEEIQEKEPGEFHDDVTSPRNGRFSYFNPELTLQKNDVVHYWVFVQHDRRQLLKLDQSWTVNELLPLENINCKQGISKVDGKSSCAEDTILFSKFNSIDSTNWLVEQYIPSHPDWEFNIYQASPDIVNIENEMLHIRPKLQEQNAKRDLDLNPGCTRKDKNCFRPYISVYNPPVVSGKLQSKKSFCFGNVTVKAKLPIGDYLYPKIYLEDVIDPQRRILIAYARGNKNYVSANGVDDGGCKYFGGPYTKVSEPQKSKYLSSFKNDKVIGSEWHTFTLIWKPDLIDLFMDGMHVGHHGSETLDTTGFNQDKMVRIVLGVGVGGPYEFPDGYKTSGVVKPYINQHREAIKEFLESKHSWLNSWSDDSQLVVDYVSVIAL